MPRSSSSSPQDNALLAALPEAELKFLSSHLKWMELAQSEVLHEEGNPPKLVYFLTRGVAAISVSTAEGKSLDLSLVGPEGVVGERAIFEGGMRETRCEMLTQGGAYTLTPRFFNKEFQGGGKLHDLIMRTLEARILETSQTALCAQMHSLEQHLSRWLLTFADRFQKEQIPLTHEKISQMLGANRAGVSNALGDLVEAGLIEQSRGLISILDRKGLEQMSCECYEVNKEGALRAYHSKNG